MLLRISKVVLFLPVAALLFSCSPSRRFAGTKSAPNTGTEADESIGETIVGYATYYGPGFHGNKTASGEVFDMYAMTCAHRTLPFGTMLLVTNLSNGKHVTVRVNDRGPFIEGRILDLSYGAAKKIDLDGKEMVRIKILK